MALTVEKLQHKGEFLICRGGTGAGPFLLWACYPTPEDPRQVRVERVPDASRSKLQEHLRPPTRLHCEPSKYAPFIIYHSTLHTPEVIASAIAQLEE